MVLAPHKRHGVLTCNPGWLWEISGRFEANSVAKSHTGMAPPTSAGHILIKAASWPKSWYAAEARPGYVIQMESLKTLLHTMFCSTTLLSYLFISSWPPSLAKHEAVSRCFCLGNMVKITTIKAKIIINLLRRQCSWAGRQSSGRDVKSCDYREDHPDLNKIN